MLLYYCVLFLIVVCMYVVVGSELLAKFKAPQLALETFTNTVSKQAANLLTTHLESGSMDGDKFKDIQKPLLELVHQLQTGHGCTAAEAMEVIQVLEQFH